MKLHQLCRITLWLSQLKTMIYSSLFFLRQCEFLDWSDLFSLSAPFPLPLTRPISSSLRFQHGGFVSKNICAPEENAYKKSVRKFMSRISGIIAFQTKKSNLERDSRKETDIKWVTKGNRKIPTLTRIVVLVFTKSVGQKWKKELFVKEKTYKHFWNFV